MLGTGVVSGAVLFILLRILAVAHWDWTVAGLIAESMHFHDAIGIVLGTLFWRADMTAVAVMVLTPVAAVSLIWRIKHRRPAQIAVVFALPLLVAATVSLTASQHMWWLPLGVVVLFVVLLLLWKYWGTEKGKRAFQRLLLATGALVAVWLFLFAVLIDTPWVGREHIEITDRGVVDGYVLEVEPGFVKVLAEEPREISFVLPADIESRTPAH
ncbi:MAG: hypothetical protein CSA63_00220 [Propionibacterium sp.]|nr:MAG: hypothetical protein CSA63_00220 [Propionibacterium sp.]